MTKKQIALVVLLLGIITHSSFGENVTFKSSSESGKLITLTGVLKKPEGNGPFPAVVLLHGCGGFEDSKNRSEAWSERLLSWGYVTLIVDSFGPRGVSSICNDTMQILHFFRVRAQDSYDGKDFLTKLPYVDGRRIALMGWSHGAGVVLKALNKWLEFEKKNAPFNAGIAFYPYCNMLKDKDAPLLILIGELDDWTHADLCTEKKPSGKTEHEIILKIYSGAYHQFDWEGKGEIYEGHRLQYDPKAASDAKVQVKDFLTKYMM